MLMSKSNLLVLGFLILQMSHKSSFSVSSISLAIDFFFIVGVPPYEPRDVSKKKLKLAAKTTCLPGKSLIVSNILPRSRRVAACSVSVLGF